MKCCSIESIILRIKNLNNVFFKKIKEKNNPGTDPSKLNSILEKQESHLNFLYSKDANYLDYLDRDELFQTLIKYSKNSIHPSSLIYWLSRDNVSRENQINLWLEPINFISQSVSFLLTTIRKSVTPIDQLAKNGFFTDKLDSQRNILLIRVALTSDHYFFPSISVGKQRFSIRFMTKNDENKYIAETVGKLIGKALVSNFKAENQPKSILNTVKRIWERIKQIFKEIE